MYCSLPRVSMASSPLLQNSMSPSWYFVPEALRTCDRTT